MKKVFYMITGVTLSMSLSSCFFLISHIVNLSYNIRRIPSIRPGPEIEDEWMVEQKPQPVGQEPKTAASSFARYDFNAAFFRIN